MNNKLEMMKTLIKTFGFNFKNCYYTVDESEQDEDNISCPNLYENSIISNEISLLRVKGSHIVDTHNFRPSNSSKSISNSEIKEGEFIHFRVALFENLY